MTGSRKALVVGIDHYDHFTRLHGCVNDADAVKKVLSRNEDGSRNFDVKLMLARDVVTSLRRSDLKDAVAELFAEPANDIALLYFAGHGHFEDTGGYLCGSECNRGDDGLALADVVELARTSKSTNIVIVLDSCHSGSAGARPGAGVSELRHGMTILTAATETQYASEMNDHGLFTELMIDALHGAAANLVGDVTPGSVYAHIDQSLGRWSQRPVFKTNVSEFISLRSVVPAIAPPVLARIATLFPRTGFEFPLDPSYEPREEGKPPGSAPADPAHTEVFAVLQQYNREGLLKPVGVTHMWDAAIASKSCKLTPTGEHWRRLAAADRF